MVGVGALVLLGAGAFVGRIVVGGVSVGGTSTDGRADGACVDGTSASVGVSVLVGCAAGAFGCAPAMEAVGVLVATTAAFVVAVAATGDAVGATVAVGTTSPGWLDSTATGTIPAAPSLLRSSSAAIAAWGASGGRLGSTT